MSTLTGNDVMGLMEAYQAVYAPQELTEEQVWEEVEEWVNTLIEEGYDLSDYTWEEMYESYINESPNLKEFFGPGMEKAVKGSGENKKYEAEKKNADKIFRSGGGQAALDQARSRRENLSRDDVIKRGKLALKGKPEIPPTVTKNSPYTEKNLGADQFKAYKAGGGDAARKDDVSAAQIIARGRKASSAAASSSSGGDQLPTPAPTPKPPSSTPAAKPAPKPAGPTKPAIGTTAGGTKFERRAATGAELRAAQAARAAAKAAGDTKGAEEAAVKAGVEAGKSASKPAVTSRPSGFGVPTAPLAAKLSATTSTASPTPTAAPKASPPPPKKETAPPPPPKTPISSSYEYDAYDLVLEYLLSQGHADTLEEANYVMLEMGVEMIGDIVEVMTEVPSVTIPSKNKKGQGDGSNPPSHGEYKEYKYTDEPKLPTKSK